MTISVLKAYLLAKPCVKETYPFGEDPMVIKVMNKMFALVSVSRTPLTVSLKADPEDAQVQRSMYSAIKPGYHLNKEHWNTITIDDRIPDDIVFQLIDESYSLVVNGLKKMDREKVLIKVNRKEE